MKENSPVLRLCLLAMAIGLMNGCSKHANEASPVNKVSSADIVAFSINGQDAQVSISQSEYTVLVQLPATFSSGTNLVAAFTLSPGCTAAVNNQAQMSGVSANDFTNNVTYAITAPGQVPQNWTITATNNSYTNGWGMGHFLQSSLNNNRSYDWYIDQGQHRHFRTGKLWPFIGYYGCKVG